MSEAKIINKTPASIHFDDGTGYSIFNAGLAHKARYNPKELTKEELLELTVGYCGFNASLLAPKYKRLAIVNNANTEGWE